jgi:molecular chaperone GrpE
VSEAETPDRQQPSDVDETSSDAGATDPDVGTTAAASPDTDAAPSPGTSAAPDDDASTLSAEHAREAEVVAAADADPRSRHQLHADLLDAEAKRDEYLDDLRRAHADFENYRKRVTRDGNARYEAGKADVALALLDVLDDLDRTLAAADGSADPDLAKGVQLVATNLRTALEGAGLVRIDLAEVPFDPTIHEAVQQFPADDVDAQPTVAQVLRPGYVMGDRTLRAAMVAVAG